MQNNRLFLRFGLKVWNLVCALGQTDYAIIFALQKETKYLYKLKKNTNAHFCTLKYKYVLLSIKYISFKYITSL